MKLSLVIALSLFTSLAWSKAKVSNVVYSSLSSDEGSLTIKLSEAQNVTPSLRIDPKMIQVELKGAEVWPKINKKAAILSTSFDTELMAYQFDRDTVRVRAYLPYQIEGQEDKVQLDVKGDLLTLRFPKTQSKASTVGNLVTKPQPKKVETPKIELDEKYLEELLGSVEKETKTKDPLKTETETVIKTDKVEIKKSAPSRIFSESDKKDKNFNLTSYIGKFVAILGVMLLLLYGVVAAFKKGFLGKGKAGLFGKNKMIDVLNTTYVGPKKSLMLVKVQNQVFLVGMSDTGFTMLSEIDEGNALMKTGEQITTGTNFDLELNTANQEDDLDQRVKLKEVVNGSYPVDLAEASVAVQEKVRFSDKVREKVKTLRPLN